MHVLLDDAAVSFEYCPAPQPVHCARAVALPYHARGHAGQEVAASRPEKCPAGQVLQSALVPAGPSARYGGKRTARWLRSQAAHRAVHQGKNGGMRQEDSTGAVVRESDSWVSRGPFKPSASWYVPAAQAEQFPAASN